MLVETHPTVLGELPRIWLADIVHQCRPPQHQIWLTRSLLIHRLPKHLQAMRIHILVLVVLILRQLQPWQLWEHIIRQPRGYHEINPQPRLRPQQHLIQLHLHSLHRDPLDL